MTSRWTMTDEGVKPVAHEQDSHTLEVHSQEDDYGDMEAWCALLKGVDPEHGWLRLFCSPIHQRVRENEWVLEFALIQPGGYECCVAQGQSSRYVWFDGVSVVSLDESQMRARVLGSSTTTRAEVDVACQHELWEDAGRMACNLATLEARGEALLAIRERREERDASGLIRLLGTPRQRQWASRIREQALARLSSIQGGVLGQESVTLSGVMAPEHLDLAMTRVKTEQRATFWIEMRDALAAHPSTHFIEALVIGAQLDVIEHEEKIT